MYPHAILRRLYPGEDEHGDTAVKAAASRARIDEALAIPGALVDLWWAACSAADYSRTSATLAQRRELCREEARVRNVEQGLLFAARGFYGRPVKLLLSFIPANFRRPEVRAVLESLHPTSERLVVVAPRDQLSPAPRLTAAAAEKFLHTMDKISTAGPDRMRVRHVKAVQRLDVADASRDEGVRVLLEVLQVWADFDVEADAAAPFGSEKLVGIYKRPEAAINGGMSSLVVGSALRRLASTMVLHRVLGPAHEYLLPKQISKVLPAGTECLVYGFREVYKKHRRNLGKISLRATPSNRSADP